MDDQVTWDDDGHSTRAYEAWKRARGEVAAFFELTQDLTKSHYDRLWQAVIDAYDDGMGDAASDFGDRVKGL